MEELGSETERNPLIMQNLSPTRNGNAPTIEGVHASVDYLTVTTKTGQASADMVKFLIDKLSQEHSFHSNLKRWRFMGFSGSQWNGVRWGIRGDEAIAMLHGEWADILFPALITRADNCTRIDLAVTCLLDTRKEKVASDAFAEHLALSSKKSSIIENSDGGSTLYLGSRHSRFFGRLYDKGSQLNFESALVWRYEVEVKKPASLVLAKRLVENTNRARGISAFVYGWFKENGVTPLFTATDGYNAIEIPRSEPDDDKSLAWLAKSVKPVVARLIASGRREEIYQSLGLPTPSEIRQLARLQEEI